MSLPIASIQPVVLPVSGANPLSAVTGTAGPTFASVLSNAIGGLQQSQNNTQATIDKFLSGENEEVHQVAIATQQTQLAFDMAMAVRNKVVSAYQEVMRMQM
jgi:flagellar hook-basal body complex protein FliE